jgi:2-polyprenyl-3-methyl-5-hydroxy-6-metoxy-1,4-benzoquinol methylase
LTPAEIHELDWYQRCDADGVVVPPNMFRHSRRNSDTRYASALAGLQTSGLAPGGRILDIGCGVSAQAGSFAQYRYIGVDLNRQALRYGHSQHPSAHYVVQSITHIGFRDGTFDGILCLEVIEHLPQAVRLAMCRELLRILRPGGALMLSTPDGTVTPWKQLLGRKCEASHETELPPAEVRALVRQAGGSVEDQREIENLILPSSLLGAVIAHLVGDRGPTRELVRRVASRAGYRTVLYLLRAA